MFALNWLWFPRRRFLNIFPIRSYVKIMSGHLGWRSGSTDTILKLQKGDYPKTMPAKFGSNWPSGFRGEDKNVKS